MNRKVDDIAEAMRGDVPPWRMPWVPDGGFPTNAFTDRRYSGLNPLTMNLSAMKRSFTSKYWATYKQWGRLGCKVKNRPDNVPEGQWGVMVAKPMGNQYPVFNGDQVYGSTAGRWKSKLVGVVEPDQVKYDRVDQIIEATGAEIRWGNFKLPQYKRPPKDFIGMPWKKQFVNVRQLYASQLHELIHHAEWRTGWTGSEELGELIAEIGQCYLETELGIPHCEDLTNHHKYVSTWLRVISEDSNFLYQAVAQAEKAVDFILNFSYSVVARHDGA